MSLLIFYFFIIITLYFFNCISYRFVNLIFVFCSVILTFFSTFMYDIVLYLNHYLFMFLVCFKGLKGI